jgi:BioD-like phosphotransacetylase family protein
MKGIIVASTASYAGKSGVCVALLQELEDRGFSPGYFKPYGTMPAEIEGTTTDNDAAYINDLLRYPSPVESVCGIVRTRSFIEETLAGRTPPAADAIKAAYAEATKRHDVMIIEGPSDPAQGRSAGASFCDISPMLDADVLLVDRIEGLQLPDTVLDAKDRLGDRLVGVVYNAVREPDRSGLLDHVVPFLASQGVRCFGHLDFDPLLSSVTVEELHSALGGTVLCAEDRMDQLVESFMVGAMGQDKALRFFRRKARKAVITGGDRGDVQLAALETSTSALVLTGNVPPSSVVLSRADELGVPMIMVDMDTLTAVERLEGLMGQVRLHGPGKAGRIREMFARDVAVDDLLTAFGL